MTLTIDLPSELDGRLKREAVRLGVAEADFARRLIEQGLSPDRPVADQATLDLLSKWDQEDATDDPEEIARRQREWEELEQALNRNRLESGDPNASRG